MEDRKLEKIEAQLAEMRKHNYAVAGQVNELVTLLKGDGFGSKGLVDQVRDNKERVKKLEALKDRATWSILGLSASSAYGFWEFFRRIFGGS